MAMEDAIRNRVEESGIVQLDLSALLRERTLRDLDLAPQLWQGLAIREQEFRSWLKDLDVTPFERADVAIHCSAEAILPEWVWMLVTSRSLGSRAVCTTVARVRSRRWCWPASRRNWTPRNTPGNGSWSRGAA